MDTEEQPGHQLFLKQAWRKLSGPLRTWIHRPTDPSGKRALLAAYEQLGDEAKAAFQVDVNQALQRAHGGGKFTAYRMLKSTDSKHSTGGMSLSTEKFPV